MREFPQRSGVPQWMSLASRDCEMLAEQRPECESRIESALRGEPQSKIEGPVPDERNERRMPPLGDANLGIGVLLAKARHRVCEEDHPRRSDTERNRSAARTGEMRQLLFGFAQFRARRPGSREERTTGRGHHYAMLRPLHQTYPQVPFELPYGLGDRRGRNVKSPRGSPDAPCVDDGEKDLELMEAHDANRQVNWVRRAPSYARAATVVYLKRNNAPKRLLMNRIARHGTLATGLILASIAAHAGAQPAVAAYPTKPIRIIVNSAPGSPPDVVARIIGERLALALGQPIVVENRQGAVGTIALAAVAKAAADGYTLGTISPPHTAAPSLLAQMPYDTARDLAPVRQMTRASYLLLVRSNSPMGSLSELIALAKEQPGHLTYASSGNGTPPHLAAEMFKLQAGIKIHHVPYKGAPAAMTALLGEQVELLFATVSTAGTHLRSGKLRALATTGLARIAAFPEVPTAVELGFRDFQVWDWQGLVAPGTTPKPIVERIAAEVGRVLEGSEVQQRFAAIGMEPVADSAPEAFGALIRSELTRWARVVREADIRVD